MDWLRLATMGPTWEECKKIALIPFKNDDELIGEILKWQDCYNHTRKLTEDYSSKEVSAYIFYFFSTHLGRLKTCLARLPLEIQEDLFKTEFVDVGAGPATYTLAWYANIISRNPTQQLQKSYLIEQSMNMRKAADLVLDYYLRDLDCRYYNNIMSLPEMGGTSTYFFGHSLNEMNVEIVISEILQKNPTYLFFLEPGTKQSFAKMLSMRTLLLASNQYQVIYPCARSEICPLERQKENWCHQYVDLRFDPAIEGMCQKMKRDRKRSPLIFHLYKKVSENSKIQSQHEGIHFKNAEDQKGKIVFSLCKNKNGKNVLEEKMILKRHLSKAQEKQMAKILAGDIFDTRLLPDLSPSELELERGPVKK